MPKTCSLVRVGTLLSLMTLAASTWAANHDESTDGDLSGDQFMPTDLAIDAGDNVITASTTAQPTDRDFVTLQVPEGLEISAIVLSQYRLVDQPSDGGSLVALEAGEQITDLDSSDALRGFAIAGVNPGTEPGDDLLDDLGGAPLGSGAWTLWIQNTGSVTEYQLTVQANAAPVVPPPVTPTPGPTVPIPTLGPLGLLFLVAAMLSLGLLSRPRP